MSSVPVPSVLHQAPIPEIRPHPTQPRLWQVRSRSHPGQWHDVDALNETCTCLGFAYRCETKAQSTFLHPNEARWCWHLRQIMALPVEALMATLPAQPRLVLLPAPKTEPARRHLSERHRWAHICLRCGQERERLTDDVCGICRFGEVFA